MPDYYGELTAILGSPCAIVPIGVPVGQIPGGVAGENPAKTTVTTKGLGAGDGLVWTYSSARNTWVGPQYYKGRNHVLHQKFAGPTNYLEAIDDDFWSLLAGAGDDGPCSMGAFVNLIAGEQDTEKMLFNKLGTAGEWALSLGYPGANKFSLYFRDHSAAVFAERQSDAALPLGRPIFIAATSAGTGGATAANGITLYSEGKVFASTAVNNASYVAMENGANVPAIGRRSGSATLGFTSIHVSVPGIFLCKKELSATEVATINAIGLEMQKNFGLERRRLRGR